MPWLRLAFCCLIWLAWVPSASAHTVVLLRPPNQSPATAELLERLRGELLSIGFEVLLRARPASSATRSPEPWQSTLSAEVQCEAAIDVIGEPTPVAVDVWLIEGAQNFELLARVEGDSSSLNHSKGLAIRASEVLRARLFEPPARKGPPPSSGAVPSHREQTVELEPRSIQRAGRLGFELGAAAFTSLDGIGPALLPLIRLDWAIRPEVVLQTTLAGLGTRPNLSSPAGEAQVAMQYALLGACYRADWPHPVRPIAGLSLGALRTSVDGHAEPPKQGHFVDQWSFLLDVSFGAAFQLSPHYALILAGHAQLAEPYVAVHLGDQRVGSLGRPNLLASLTLGVWP